VQTHTDETTNNDSIDSDGDGDTDRPNIHSGSARVSDCQYSQGIATFDRFGSPAKTALSVVARSGRSGSHERKLFKGSSSSRKEEKTLMLFPRNGKRVESRRQSQAQQRITKIKSNKSSEAERPRTRTKLQTTGSFFFWLFLQAESAAVQSISQSVAQRNCIGHVGCVADCASPGR
jgi:hypothetical protein